MKLILFELILRDYGDRVFALRLVVEQGSGGHFVHAQLIVDNFLSLLMISIIILRIVVVVVDVSVLLLCGKFLGLDFEALHV